VCDMSMYSHVLTNESSLWYGVVTISKLLKIIGLFCRISSLLQGSFAKKTYHFQKPTNRSHHPICWRHLCILGVATDVHTLIPSTQVDTLLTSLLSCVRHDAFIRLTYPT